MTAAADFGILAVSPTSSNTIRAIRPCEHPSGQTGSRKYQRGECLRTPAHPNRTCAGSRPSGHTGGTRRTRAYMRDGCPVSSSSVWGASVTGNCRKDVLASCECCFGIKLRLPLLDGFVGDLFASAFDGLKSRRS